MKLFAFQGTRYHSSNEDRGCLAVPPFDQIDRRLAERLRQDPHSFAHLTRPDPDSADPHQLAAETQAAWREGGALERDAEPSLYLYETRLATGGFRLGLCGLIGLDESPIQPHERTVSKIIEERLDLVAKTATDLEPIFLLVNDSGTLNEELAGDREDVRWLASYHDELGHLHSISAIADPERIERYKQVLEGQSGLIADGHHRYQVACHHSKRIAAKAGTAAASKLVVIVSLQTPHLTIDPIHRALIETVDLERIRRWVTASGPWNGQTGSGLAVAVATARQPAIGAWNRGESPEIWTLDSDAIRAQAADPTPDLPVALLNAVLGDLGLETSAPTDGTLTYRSDPDRLYSEMSAGKFGASFWLPPMSPSEFSEALRVCELCRPSRHVFCPSWPRAWSGRSTTPYSFEAPARQDPMPTYLRPDDKPVVQFDPLREISPFTLFRRIRDGRRPELVDVRANPRSLTLRGASAYGGDDWEPGEESEVVLFDNDGTEAEPIVRRLQAAGFERVKMLFGGLELYEFSLDPQVVGEETFLEPIDS